MLVYSGDTLGAVQAYHQAATLHAGFSTAHSALVEVLVHLSSVVRSSLCVGGGLTCCAPAVQVLLDLNRVDEAFEVLRYACLPASTRSSPSARVHAGECGYGRTSLQPGQPVVLTALLSTARTLRRKFFPDDARALYQYALGFAECDAVCRADVYDGMRRLLQIEQRLQHAIPWLLRDRVHGGVSV